MSDKVNGNLLAILDSIAKIINYTEDLWDAEAFYADSKTFDAVLMNFVVIGESVIRLPESYKLAHTHIPWIKIKDFRNIVAHDYFGVDAEEVWQIIKTKLPELQAQIHHLLL